MEVPVPVMDNEECKRAFANKKSVIDERVLCAGYLTGGKDACQVLTQYNTYNTVLKQIDFVRFNKRYLLLFFVSNFKFVIVLRAILEAL